MAIDDMLESEMAALRATISQLEPKILADEALVERLHAERGYHLDADWKVDTTARVEAYRRAAKWLQDR